MRGRAGGVEGGARAPGRGVEDEGSRAREEGLGEAPDHRGGAEVEEDARSGLECAGDLRGPVGGFDEDPGGEAARAIGVDLASSGDEGVDPGVDEDEGLVEEGGVEGGADGERVEDGGERRAAVEALLEFAVRALRAGLEGEPGPGERFGPTGEDERCGAVDDRDSRVLDVGDDFGDEAVREAADGEHGGIRAARARSEALGDGFGGRADEEGQGEDGSGARLLAADAGAEEFGAEDPLGVAEDHERLAGEVEAEGVEVGEGAELGEEDARSGDGRGEVGGGVVRPGEDGLEPFGCAGGGGEQIEGDRRDELAGFAVGASDVLAGAREGEGFGEGGPPGGALTAEEEGEGRAEGVE